MANPYEIAHNQSIEDPNGFWGAAAEDCQWYKKWDKVLDDSNKPFYRWFSGGEMNTCYNALDYHIENGRGEQNAMIYDSPVTDTIKKYTYTQLRDEVARFAGALAAQDVGKGDRVLIYMPMIPEGVIAMLACARLGAVHSVVFGGFAANELAVRINDAKPKAIVSASCGIEVARIIAYKPLLDAAIDMADFKPDCCIIKQRPMEKAVMIEGRDLDWDDVLAKAEPHDCVPVAATDPLYILYTSGTTGVPKGVVRDNGGHMVALKWTMKAIYNVDAGDVYWAASDVGWVVGHSYIVYGPLLKGCTTILFEGKPVGTPDAGVFWRVISEHNVKVMFRRRHTRSPSVTGVQTCALPIWDCIIFRSKKVRPPKRRRAGPCRPSMKTATRLRPAKSVRWWPNFRCRRARFPRCGTMIRVFWQPIWKNFRDITKPQMPGLSMTRVMFL
jgi:propionyl-CoA synthetase